MKVSGNAAATAAAQVKPGKVTEDSTTSQRIRVVGANNLHSHGVMMTSSTSMELTTGHLLSALTPHVPMQNSDGTQRIDPQTGRGMFRVRALGDLLMGNAPTTTSSEDKPVAKPAKPKPPKPADPPLPPPADSAKDLDVGARPLSLADRLVMATSDAKFKENLYASKFETDIIDTQDGNKRLASRTDRMEATPADTKPMHDKDTKSDGTGDKSDKGGKGDKGAGGSSSSSSLKF